jgi:quercetin dioxygenase-like cupin family protein
MLVRREDRRTTETPNGVMTTYASPTLGGAELALWHVAIPAGKAGPLHSFDGEQVWTITAGAARLELGDEELNLQTGDSVVLPSDVLRRLTADPADGFEALVAARPGIRARMPDGTDRGVPPWIA